MNILTPIEIIEKAGIQRDPNDMRPAGEIAELLLLYGSPKPLTLEERARLDQIHNLTSQLRSVQDPRIGRLGRIAL